MVTYPRFLKQRLRRLSPYQKRMVMGGLCLLGIIGFLSLPKDLPLRCSNGQDKTRPSHGILAYCLPSSNTGEGRILDRQEPTPVLLVWAFGASGQDRVDLSMAKVKKLGNDAPNDALIAFEKGIGDGMGLDVQPQTSTVEQKTLCNRAVSVTQIEGPLLQGDPLDEGDKFPTSSSTSAIKYKAAIQQGEDYIFVWLLASGSFAKAHADQVFKTLKCLDTP